jgi:hypothetical protein
MSGLGIGKSVSAVSTGVKKKHSRAEKVRFGIGGQNILLLEIFIFIFIFYFISFVNTVYRLHVY